MDPWCASCSPMSRKPRSGVPRTARASLPSWWNSVGGRASTAWRPWSGRKRRRRSSSSRARRRWRCMARAVPPGGYLLAGAARAEGRIDDGVWNSLLVIDGTGAIVAHYDKVHLVPLGEYIPFHKQLAPRLGIHRPRLVRGRRSTVTIGLSGLAVLLAHNLLRGDLPGRRHRSWRAAAMAAERHQRRLVRPVDRSLPASGERPPARGRGGPADDPVGQYRRIGRDRRLWPCFGLTRHAAAGHHRSSYSAGARGHSLQPLGRLDAAGVVSYFSVRRCSCGGRQKVGNAVA